MSRKWLYKALLSVNIIKEKWCGKIKARTYAYGSSKWNYILHEEATWLNISLEALFVSLKIDAHEGRSLHTFDVSGAYIHVFLPDDKIVQIKSEGGFLDIMCKVNLEYKNS